MTEEEARKLSQQLNESNFAVSVYYRAIPSYTAVEATPGLENEVTQPDNWLILVQDLDEEEPFYIVNLDF